MSWFGSSIEEPKNASLKSVLSSRVPTKYPATDT